VASLRLKKGVECFDIGMKNNLLHSVPFLATIAVALSGCNVLLVPVTNPRYPWSTMSVFAPSHDCRKDSLRWAAGEYYSYTEGCYESRNYKFMIEASEELYAPLKVDTILTIERRLAKRNGKRNGIFLYYMLLPNLDTLVVAKGRFVEDKESGRITAYDNGIVLKDLEGDRREYLLMYENGRLNGLCKLGNWQIEYRNGKKNGIGAVFLSRMMPGWLITYRNDAVVVGEYIEYYSPTIRRVNKIMSDSTYYRYLE
jgi:hypothetical protein